MAKSFKRSLLKQLIVLSTSGFGLVAALAWNEAIQTLIKEYLNDLLHVGNGVVSKFIYAIIITTIAVFITYQLTKLVDKD